jgi:hypothetical protein
MKGNFVAEEHQQYDTVEFHNNTRKLSLELHRLGIERTREQVASYLKQNYRRFNTSVKKILATPDLVQSCAEHLRSATIDAPGWEPDPRSETGW